MGRTSDGLRGLDALENEAALWEESGEEFASVSVELLRRWVREAREGATPTCENVGGERHVFECSRCGGYTTGFGSKGRWAVDLGAVRYAMGRAGLGTWRALATAAGLSENTTWNVCTGRRRNPSASTMCAIATALGCDVMDLMREVGE